MVTPEFSHVVKLTDIGSGATHIKLTANEAERSALAERFGLLTLDQLEADIALSREARGFLAEGRLTAKLGQACIATGEPVPATMDEPIKVLFIAEPAHAADSEVELDADDCDMMFHDGQGVDIGEAAAQSLGLALDPYPRSANADGILKQAGVISEETAQQESSPFGALAALKDKLKN